MGILAITGKWESGGRMNKQKKAARGGEEQVGLLFVGQTDGEGKRTRYRRKKTGEQAVKRGKSGLTADQTAL